MSVNITKTRPACFTRRTEFVPETVPTLTVPAKKSSLVKGYFYNPESGTLYAHLKSGVYRYEGVTPEEIAIAENSVSIGKVFNELFIDKKDTVKIATNYIA